MQNFIEEASVDFGSVRFIRPNDHFPEIRFRFTPAAGLIYGSLQTGKDLAQKMRILAIIRFLRLAGFTNTGPITSSAGMASAMQMPERDSAAFACFAIEPPAPSWLYDNRAISRGYLDDACDGFVEVYLKLHDRTLAATARICSAPPAMAPDSLFVRTLVDDLEQVIYGPEVPPHEPAEVTRARAQDIVRRAYETVRFMNVAVMNGNDFKGRPALTLDSMPQEEAADTERTIRPVMRQARWNTLAIMALHQQAYAALRSGARRGSCAFLRKPDEVADFTDHGRRKMPALMCGADNNYLALTWRQIDTIRKAALCPPVSMPPLCPPQKVGSRQRICRAEFLMRPRAIRSVRAQSLRSPIAVPDSKSISARSGAECFEESNCGSMTISWSMSIKTATLSSDASRAAS